MEWTGEVTEVSSPIVDSSTGKRAASLAFRQFFYFLDFLASTPELGPQNPSLGRKFYVESDFVVKNKEFRHPESKN